MATSGSFDTNGYNGKHLTFSWSRSNTPNGADNYSDVYWELKGAGGSGWHMAGDFTVVIDGETVYSNATRIKLYDGTVVASGTKRIYHNTDGTRSFSASVSASIYTYAVDKSGSGSWNLDTIPRYFSGWSVSQKSNTLNSVTIQWATNEERDWTGWSFQMGIPDTSKSYTGSATYSENVASNGKSGTFIIKNLAPGTNQLVTIAMRRKDSQLWSYKNITVTTKSIANITSPNSDFSHNSDSSLTVKCNNSSGNKIAYFLDCPSGTRRLTSGKTTNTSYTWSAAQILSMLQYFPNENSKKIKVGLITYGDDDTTEYYNERVGTLNVVNSNPTFSNFTYEDTDSKCIQLTGGNQGIIKGYSDVKIKVSAANKAVAKNYASISKYRAVIGEQQKDFDYSSSNEVNTIISNVLSNIFIVYAIDSRGNSTQKQISPSNYYNYSKIQIKEGTAVRTGGVGSEVTLSFNGTYWNKTFGNIMNSIKSLKYYYKQTSSNTWIEGGSLTPVLNGENFSYEATIRGDLGAEGFNITKSFNIKVVVSDELSSSEYTITLGSGTPAIALYKEGVAINGMYNVGKEPGLQVFGKLYLNGQEITN